MEKALKQDEIDALFAGKKNAPPASAADGEGKGGPRLPAYNFSRAGQISNEQMRAISMLNDTFARNLAHNLGVWLRARFEVILVSAEQIAFSEFLVRLPELAYVCSVRLEPLGAVAVMQLDLSLAPPIIDLLLGGQGKSGTVRELTDIEESILGSVVEVVCRELSAAWQPVGLSFEYERRYLQTQVSRILPPTEKTLCLSFEVRMPEASGILNLVVPAVVSNTILRRLIGDRARQRQHSGEVRDHMRRVAGLIPLGAVLQLPPVRLAAAELDALEPGKIVPMRVAANAASEVRVAGVPLFVGRPVRLGEYRGAYLGEVLEVLPDGR